MDKIHQSAARREILSAYSTALGDVAGVVECCTGARSGEGDDSAGVDDARLRLMRRFDFTDVQADAVLRLQLLRLAPAQISRIRAELADVDELIARSSGGSHETA